MPPMLTSFKHRTLTCLLMVGLVIAGTTACASTADPIPTLVPTPDVATYPEIRIQETFVATPSRPVQTASLPTPVPLPTVTEVPTSTLSQTPTLAPTLTPTLVPTPTPEPTATPIPTATPSPVATRVPYYTQIIAVEGVNIKANETVDPAAVQAGADVVGVMLSGRDNEVRRQ